MRKKVIALAGLIFLNIGLQIVNPQIIRYYLDSVNGNIELNQLRIAAFLFLGIALVQFGVQIVNVFLSQDISWSSTNLLREDLLRHCVNLDMSFHHQYKPGQMIERVDGDVNALSNFFSQMALQLISNILLIVGILFALYFEDITLGIIFTLFTFGSLILAYIVRNLAVPYFKKWRAKDMELFGYIEERIGGTEDIRALGAENTVMRDYHFHEKERYDVAMKAIVVSRLINLVFTAMIAFGTTLVYMMGVPLYQSGDITIGTLFLLGYYVGLLINPIFTILRQIQNLQEADASIERIEELFAIENKVIDSGTNKLNGSGFSLNFQNVNFAYFEENYVLNKINFLIEDGKSIGLIGRTGSGKTTISRLIFRLYDINEGSILINGDDIKSYDLTNLRENIALVTQDVQLFATTLRSNITFFDEDISDTEILRVIKEVGLSKWYNNLEKGLDTEMSSNEHGLSAGEAQLLALSRVFLKNPRIVILDEASSRLDYLTEKYLDKAIEKLIAEKTALIIAHRLETLNKVDQILMLEDGEVVEFGNREELAKDPKSKFFALLQTGSEEILV